MSLTRVLTVSSGVCAALLLSAAPASAAPPFEKFSFTLKSSSPTDASGYCAFPVLLQGVQNVRSVPPRDPGSTRFVGAAFVTATNTQTGESISFNVSGPYSPISSPDGGLSYTGTGGQLAWTSVENSFSGVSPLTYTTGLLSFTVAPDGTTTSYSARGRSIDVCAELAP